MKQIHTILVFLFLLSGCVSWQAQIARRIAEHPEHVANLTEADQARIRKGELKVGDSKGVAWCIYGQPDRRLKSATPQFEEETSIYTTVQIDPYGYPAAPWYRQSYRGGYAVYPVSQPYVYEEETLRIVFRNGFVYRFRATLEE